MVCMILAGIGTEDIKKGFTRLFLRIQSLVKLTKSYFKTYKQLFFHSHFHKATHTQMSSAGGDESRCVREDRKPYPKMYE